MEYKISESQFFNMFLRRRLNRFGKYVRSTYTWLRPEAFNDYNSFLHRVTFSALSDFLSVEGDLDYATYDKLRDQVLPFMKRYVEKEYGGEIIRKYFDKEVRK